MSELIKPRLEDMPILQDITRKIAEICGDSNGLVESYRHPLLDTKSTHGKVSFDSVKKTQDIDTMIGISFRTEHGVKLHNAVIGLGIYGAMFTIIPHSTTGEQTIMKYLDDETYTQTAVFPNLIVDRLTSTPMQTHYQTIPLSEVDNLTYFVDTSYTNRQSIALAGGTTSSSGNVVIL